MLPAAYLRQKFVRPLLTKDGGITHHRPSAAGDEPPGAIGRGIFPPLSAVEIWLGNGARGRGMQYSLELIVFLGAPTLAWFVFFG